MASPMRTSDQGSRNTAAIVLAVGLHVAAVVAIPEFRQGVRDLVESTADFVEMAPDPEPPAEDPPPPPPRPDRQAPRTESTSNEPPPPVQESTAPPPEVITTLDGTLSNTFTITQGTGDATAPIRAGVQSTRNTEGSLNGVPDAGVPGGRGLVADADLSVRASPPSGLNDLLQRYFPADARQQGIGGRALVSIEVRADGSVARVTRLRESVADYGFADACIRMVRASGRWEPGRDRSGTEVASVIRFACEFDINR